MRNLEGKNWENDLKEIKQSIVFVDEGAKFINTEEFATAIKKSDNYYVLITRQDLGNLPYSIMKYTNWIQIGLEIGCFANSSRYIKAII